MTKSLDTGICIPNTSSILLQEHACAHCKFWSLAWSLPDVCKEDLDAYSACKDIDENLDLHRNPFQIPAQTQPISTRVHSFCMIFLVSQGIFGVWFPNPLYTDSLMFLMVVRSTVASKLFLHCISWKLSAGNEKGIHFQLSLTIVTKLTVEKRGRGSSAHVWEKFPESKSRDLQMVVNGNCTCD